MEIEGKFAGPFMFSLLEVNKLGSGYNIVAHYLGSAAGRYVIQISNTHITIMAPSRGMDLVREEYQIDERDGTDFFVTSLDSQRRHLFKFNFKSLILEERIYTGS